MLEIFQGGGVERAAERSDTAEHPGRMRGFDFLFEQLHRAVALVNVHAAGRVASGRAGQFAPSDVAAELATGETDFAHGGIRPVAGFLQIPAGGRDIEHASSGGDDATTGFRRPGMGEVDVFVRRRPVKAFDFVAGQRPLRITARGKHDGARAALAPADIKNGEMSFHAG